MLPPANGNEITTDVLVLGGGTGGVAATLALLRAGIACVISEPTGMLGGQLTTQGVPPDENPWIEGGGPNAPDDFVGANASFAEFRKRIRAYYQAHESLTPQAQTKSRLNPGGGWVSRLCFAPIIGEHILSQMLAEADANRGLISTLLHSEPVAAETNGDRVVAVHFSRNGQTIVVRPKFILEASETGDLYPLADIEHAIGAEAQHVYNERHGRTDLPPGIDHDPLNQQAITWCFAIEHDTHGQHVVPRPNRYDHWRSFVPDMTPPWTGRLFDWIVPSHNTAGRVDLPLVPPPDSPKPASLELWRYRRIVDASLHTDGRPDVSLFNVVQMDYFARPLLGVSKDDRDKAIAEAREQSLCFLYWMQTEAPRHDGSCHHGYPGLKLSGAALGSTDGFALAPYIREPRRLLARTMLTEAHLGYDQRREEGVIMPPDATRGMGELFADSVAIGHYPIDLHPSCAGRNSVYVPSCPFRVPLGSLIPQRVRNVIAAGKALGVSHVANGATRLHPVEWGIGEAAGVLCAQCMHETLEPHQVAQSARHISTLQQHLHDAGVPLRWPWEPTI